MTNSLRTVWNEFKVGFKTVGAKHKHIYKDKHIIAKSIALCFIPFLYAFIALWAFFNHLVLIIYLLL